MNLEEMRERLRSRLGDSSLSTEEIDFELKNAVFRHNPDWTVETLPENEEYLVLKLAQISCLYTLASREAKNYRIGVDGVSIDKAQRVRNYLAIAENLEKEYQSIINSEDYAKIEVENFKRYSARLNRLVGD